MSFTIRTHQPQQSPAGRCEHIQTECSPSSADIEPQTETATRKLNTITRSRRSSCRRQISRPCVASTLGHRRSDCRARPRLRPWHAGGPSGSGALNRDFPGRVPSFAANACSMGVGPSTKRHSAAAAGAQVDNKSRAVRADAADAAGYAPSLIEKSKKKSRYIFIYTYTGQSKGQIALLRLTARF